MNKKIRRCINIDKELWEKIEEIAKRDNRSISNYIEKLIKELD